jgi:hypothetical protein
MTYKEPGPIAQHFALERERTWLEVETRWYFGVGHLYVAWSCHTPPFKWRHRVRCWLRGHDTHRNGTTLEPGRYWWCPDCGKTWGSP